MSTIRSRDRRLYNKDLAPTDKKKKNWGWFEIFNVWANDVQSLFGYTLAASLFLTYGLNGWAVFLAILLAGFFIMWLVNLSGKPSVKLGVPYPVFARASMGVIGANFPAMVRGIVAMFWYGAQTYFASTAVALLLRALSGSNGGGDTFLGMDGIDWISFIFVAGFQIYLFWQGIDLIRRFLNFAGPAVYAVMIILMITIWAKAGGGLLSEVGNIFSGVGSYEGGAFAAFLAIFGTMVAYFAAQYCDVFLYHFWKGLTKGKHLWLRNNGSTMISQGVDSFMVIAVTFGAQFLAGAVSLSVMITLMTSNYLFKVLVALLDTIPLYICVHYLRPYLEIPEGEIGYHEI